MTEDTSRTRNYLLLDEDFRVVACELPAIWAVGEKLALTTTTPGPTTVRGMTDESQIRGELMGLSDGCFLFVGETSEDTRPLQRAQRLFERAFSSAPIGNALLPPNGLIERANPALCELVGASEATLIGTAFSDLIEDPASYQTAFAEILAGTVDKHVIELPTKRSDAREVWLSISLSLVEDADGSPAYVVVQTQDVSERHRLEEERRIATEQLRRSNRELEDFATVASHDLQEPLRKIQAFGDRLRRSHGESLGESGRDYLTRMQDAASRMQVLIDDLLAFSRVERKGSPFRLVDLNEVARGVTTDLQAAVSDSGATVVIEELPTIYADPLQMRQLLQNLIGNALKFRRDGVIPLVRVYPKAAAPGFIAVVVSDNGIGVEERYTDKVFAIFERLHGRDEYPGTGIGLAICRKIAGRHGGTIDLTSIPGAGSDFTVTLPQQPPEAPTR